MNLLTHVRTHHPNLWNKYTPHDRDKLKDLVITEVPAFRKDYQPRKINLDV